MEAVKSRKKKVVQTTSKSNNIKLKNERPVKGKISIAQLTAFSFLCIVLGILISSAYNLKFDFEAFTNPSLIIGLFACTLFAFFFRILYQTRKYS